MSLRPLVSLFLVFTIAACTPAAPGPTPTTSPVGVTDVPDFIPTVAPLPATATTIPVMSTATPVASSASSWKEGWVDFTNRSPAGQAYANKDHGLSQLCPDATQDTQICEEPVHLEIDSSIITTLQWVDEDRC